MITSNMIHIYKTFGGDIDSWVRNGSKKQLAVMDDNDWFLIENLLQDISLLKKGLASESFANDLSRRLEENCDNEETIEQMKKYS